MDNGTQQVTIEYAKGKNSGEVVPIRVDTVVISAQHAEEVTTEQLREDLKEKIVKKVVPAELLDDRTIYHMQPSGRFVIGGPQGDAGLTGRKIIVDSYGGVSPRSRVCMIQSYICCVRMGCSRWWSFLRQGLVQGGQVRRLRWSMDWYVIMRMSRDIE